MARVEHWHLFLLFERKFLYLIIFSIMYVRIVSRWIVRAEPHWVNGRLSFLDMFSWCRRRLFDLHLPIIKPKFWLGLTSDKEAPTSFYICFVFLKQKLGNLKRSLELSCILCFLLKLLEYLNFSVGALGIGQVTKDEDERQCVLNVS